MDAWKEVMNRLAGKIAIVTKVPLASAKPVWSACPSRQRRSPSSICSNEVKFVTGAEIVLDGGYTAR